MIDTRINLSSAYVHINKLTSNYFNSYEEILHSNAVLQLGEQKELIGVLAI